MDSILPELRASACNAIFLDRNDAPFAGLYQDPHRPVVSLQQALQELVKSFNLDFNDKHLDSGDSIWMLLPVGQRFAHHASEPCGGVFTKDLDSVEGNMMKPIQPGRYYLLQSSTNVVSWELGSVYGAVPLSFHEFRTRPHPASAAASSTSSAGCNTDIQSKTVSALMRLRKNPADCQPKDTRCVISGRGRSWSNAAMLPGLCDYPIVHAKVLEAYSPKTPSSGNWITMLPHIYEFFAAKLIAIHPDTLVIRCFGPSDVIESYHGCVAQVKDGSPLDRKILRLHYDQCVHANMTAHGIRKQALKLEAWQVRLTAGILGASTALRTSDATARDYCTQSCLLGLYVDDFLDQDCPNLAKHKTFHPNSDKPGQEKHLIDADTLSMLLQEQLRCDQQMFCQQPKASTQGNHGQFFKLTQASFGYTVVAKGMCAGHQHKLANEWKIYSQMEALQGECVPICLGVFALQVPCGVHADSKEKITHMLLLSHAGIAVENENGDNPLLPVDDEVVAMEATRTFDEINDCGVQRSDQRKKHQFWNQERGRVFFIDFEKDVRMKDGTTQVDKPPQATGWGTGCDRAWETGWGTGCSNDCELGWGTK